jgi:hypothetical protein
MGGVVVEVEAEGGVTGVGKGVWPRGLLIAVLFEHAVGSVWLVRVIEIGLTHKPYASDGVFERNCNQQRM